MRGPTRGDGAKGGHTPGPRWLTEKSAQGEHCFSSRSSEGNASVHQVVAAALRHQDVPGSSREGQQTPASPGNIDTQASDSQAIPVLNSLHQLELKMYHSSRKVGKEDI